MTNSTTIGDTPNSQETSTYSAYITEELRHYDEHLRDVRGLQPVRVEIDCASLVGCWKASTRIARSCLPGCGLMMFGSSLSGGWQGARRQPMHHNM